MRVSVIGCGYLGAVHAACMAHLGHDVVGVDADAAKASMLAEGRAPFFEPELPQLLQAGVRAGRLRFTTDIADARDAEMHFVAVGTPQRRDGNGADMRYIDSAIEALVAVLKPGALVVGKSTVPLGTADRLAGAIRDRGAELAWNPEFLREGFAVKDTLSPDRLVYGLPEGPGGECAGRMLDEVYREAVASGTPVIRTDYSTAELVKVAANAFLATKISFINAMAEIADTIGADVTDLADALGHDSRIGRRFLNAGIGFGGGCLPKDIRAFGARAEELGRGDSLAFLKQVDAINLRSRDRVVQNVTEALGEQIHGRRVAVLGLAFKPNSDDIRDSPALDIAVRLRGLGIDVVATDPEAIANSRRLHPQLEFIDDVEDAVRGADVLVLATEWTAYRALDPQRVARLVNRRVVIDGRNALDPKEWRSAGWTYRGVGRR